MGAPVGSVLLGSHALIDKARRWRKVCGGSLKGLGGFGIPILFAHLNAAKQREAELFMKWRNPLRIVQVA